MLCLLIYKVYSILLYEIIVKFSLSGCSPIYENNNNITITYNLRFSVDYSPFYYYDKDIVKNFSHCI